MDFRTYSYQGLRDLLADELKSAFTDVDYFERIKLELSKRSPLIHRQMSVAEQIHWIMEETDFKKIQQVQELLYSKSLPDNIIRLRLTAMDCLTKVANFIEDEYVVKFVEIGGFVAEKHIIDGIIVLKLYYRVAGWDFDYEEVISDNYTDDEFEGPFNSPSRNYYYNI